MMVVMHITSYWYSGLHLILNEYGLKYVLYNSWCYGLRYRDDFRANIKNGIQCLLLYPQWYFGDLWLDIEVI